MNVNKLSTVTFCLAGCPGTGKSTIRRALLERYPSDIVFLKRWATRAVRPGEEDEVAHLDEPAFVAHRRGGQLTAIFCANRTMYGLSLTELAQLFRGPKRWIGCQSASAGLSLQDRGYAITIIYLTVRHRHALLARLRERGTAEADISMRMHEFDDADAAWGYVSADHLLYTDELTIAETVERVARILGLPKVVTTSVSA